MSDTGSQISGSDDDVDATVRPRRSERVTSRRIYVESPFTTSAPSSGSDNDLDKLGHEEWFPLASVFLKPLGRRRNSLNSKSNQSFASKYSLNFKPVFL